MKYIISAGGTGGHIYPGITIAQELINNGDEVIFIASNRSIDKKILKDVDFEVKHYKMNGFIRNFKIMSIFKNLTNLFYMVIIFIRLTFLFTKFRPNGVIGMGGFISYPVVKYANFLKIKTYIHEQNSYPGLVNRKLAPIVTKVFYTYDSCLTYFKGNKRHYIYTSNPRIEEAKKYITTDKKDYILFIGGSLGAQKINDLAIEYANKNQQKVKLIVGSRYYNEYAQHKNEFIEIIEYLDNPLLMMSEAKIVVSRAGATTLLECVAMEVRVLAIPSPNVVEDHQSINAKEVQKFGIISILSESDLTLNLFEQKIHELNTKEQKENKLADINAIDLIIKNIKE
jgi:UDP-N-acetylglucosamine--N-acetylmuramyl-(pentapeptide) pyrophosphoryl-undecaprenol N-acetylglucosamine transferase